MQKYFSRILSFVILATVIHSCNSAPDPIPFPENELGYVEPVSIPLKFSPARNLTWDTVSANNLKPVVKKVDFAALPETRIDSAGFMYFNLPTETPIDLDHLPDTTFDLDAIPSQPIKLKTYLIDPPARQKISAPAIQKDNPLALYDLGVQQGMPVKFILALMKDRNGLLWISSREGIFRFDGTHLQTFFKGDGQSVPVGMSEDNTGRIWAIHQNGMMIIDPKKGTVGSFPGITSFTNNVSKIIKDNEGRLWIARSKSKEISVIDPIAMSFKSFGRKYGYSDTLNAGDVIQANNGDIWITSAQEGINIISPKAKKIRYLRASNGVASNEFRALTKDSAGFIWMADNLGNIDAINPTTRRIKHFNSEHGVRPGLTSNMTIDNRGFVWVGTSTGINVLDPVSGRMRWITTKNGLASDWIPGFALDANNRMWVATIAGLHMIDQNAETAVPIPNTQIISIMEDPNRTIWTATLNGVLLVDLARKNYRRLDQSHGLSNDFVQTITRNKDKIWVTTNGGIDIIDPINKNIEHYGQKEGLSNDTTYVAIKDKQENIWLSGPSNGLNLIQTSTKSLLHTDVEHGLSDNNTGDMKQDLDGMLWLGTSTAGVDMVDPATNKIQNLRSTPGLADTCNRILVTDDFGKVWIGTDKGIYVIDKKLNTITTLTTKEGLCDNVILSLIPYKGSVIAAANRSASLITPPWVSGDSSKKWQIKLLDKTEDLFRLQTGAWLTDGVTSDGNFIWGDNAFKVVYNVKPSPNVNSTYITGLNIMTRPKYFIDPSELNDKDTLYSADTFYVKGQKQQPKSYASSASTFKIDSVDGAFNLPVNLRLPYSENSIQFQFAQVNMNSQESAQYVYVLEGADKAWSQPTTNTSTDTYLNLHPGKYTFKVSSAGPNKIWTEPASFSFTVLPPWYQTWWAYTLFTLLGLGILRGYIVYRSRQLKAENKILEERVNSRTLQLQRSIEELKTTQTQLIQSEKMASLGELTAGIAHEIQNPLNFINNFSDVNKELLAEMGVELDKGNLFEAKEIARDIIENEEKIVFHGKRADAIVKGMLQHSRSSNGTKEPYDINALCDEYLRLSYHGLRAKDKTFNAYMKTDFDESIGKIGIVSQDIGRVVLNLFNNAFYAVTEKKLTAPPDYQPTVSVTTKRKAQGVEIRVSDNGNGIPKRVLDKIFQPFFTTKPTGIGTGLGLSLSYDIITKGHNGDIKVETQEGMGTTFIISLPTGA